MSYSGLWNNEYGEDHALLASTVKIGNAQTALGKLFANRLYGRAAVRELLHTLIGATAGGTAAMTHKRVRAERDLEANVLGGARTIETYTSINRATTAGDVTALKNAVELPSRVTSYPADAAGNGGGGKLGW